ncbi:MAG: pyruvate kinase [Rickettsiales bacterium]|nr:pyruvate kinase [Rickettsiales bacterium]
MRATKITASVGPESESAAGLSALAKAGANVFRLNFSHDTGAVQAARIKRIRALKTPAAIVADLQGPKLRIGDFATESVEIKNGASFTLDNIARPGDATRVYLPHPEVLAALKTGDSILLNDGRNELKVVKASKTKVQTIVVRGGTIKGRRGFNLPNTEIKTDILTAKDKVDLAFALKQDIDYVAVSFVQKPADIDEVREFIKRRTKKPVKIIAKIERPQALERIRDIIIATDAIMIARGDLAVETPFYKVPEITRDIIRLCRDLNRPVIMATQMMLSMVESEFPTRAEISDVATTSYLRADSAMTSDETTIGKHPALTIEMMSKILENADQDGIYNHYDWTPREDGRNAWSKSVAELARLNKASVIVVFSHTGETARLVSSRRPDMPIVSVSAESIIANQLNLCRGVYPIFDKKLSQRHDFRKAARIAGITGGHAIVVEDLDIKLEKI